MRKIGFIFALILAACGGEQPTMPVGDANWSKDKSIDMNTQFSLEEEEEIDLFLDRHTDWKMTETGTGLRYMIYDRSDSHDSVHADDIVTVAFEISLLNGEICYTATEEDAESFMVEKSDIESGLHEGIKYMCEGDRAKFILPSHTAHGLIGDTDKIPPLSPVIYDIKLLQIEHAK